MARIAPKISAGLHLYTSLLILHCFSLRMSFHNNHSSHVPPSHAHTFHNGPSLSATRLKPRCHARLSTLSSNLSEPPSYVGLSPAHLGEHGPTRPNPHQLDACKWLGGSSEVRIRLNGGDAGTRRMVSDGFVRGGVVWWDECSRTGV